VIGGFPGGLRGGGMTITLEHRLLQLTARRAAAAQRDKTLRNATILGVTTHETQIYMVVPEPNQYF